MFFFLFVKFFYLNKKKTKRLSNHMSQYFTKIGSDHLQIMLSKSYQNLNDRPIHSRKPHIQIWQKSLPNHTWGYISLTLCRIQTKLGVCYNNRDLILPAQVWHWRQLVVRRYIYIYIIYIYIYIIYAYNFWMVWLKMTKLVKVQHAESNDTQVFPCQPF